MTNAIGLPVEREARSAFSRIVAQLGLVAWRRENDPDGMEDRLTISCTAAELAAVNRSPRLSGARGGAPASRPEHVDDVARSPSLSSG
jgi:hypothetical protein